MLDQNTFDYLEHWRRQQEIATTVKNLERENDRINQIKVALERKGIDVLEVAAKYGTGNMIAFYRKQIENCKREIYKIEEAERRRDHSTLGGTYFPKQGSWN